MNIIQFFHKKETLPPFNIGDKVRLMEYSEANRLLYNKEYPNCAMSEEKNREALKRLAEEYLGWVEHIVTRVYEGTIAAGGWFVVVDGKEPGYHGNIFELVK
jgi:hypothetical protein